MGIPLYPTDVRYFVGAGGVDMNVNGSVTPATFDLTPPTGYKYTIWSIKFSFVAPWSGDNMTSYSKFMDNTALSNGISILDVRDNGYSFEAVIKKNYDFVELPVATWTKVFNDAQYALIEVAFNFNNSPIVINKNDYNRITIRDDLTFLQKFRGSARGIISLTNSDT